MKNPWAIIIAGLVVVVVVMLIQAAILMYLWNWIMPGLMHTGTLTLAKALGVLIITNILLQRDNKTNKTKASKAADTTQAPSGKVHYGSTI